MRKFVLMALAGAAIALATPQFASATPLSLGGGLAAAADNASISQEVRYRHWHYRHHYGWRHRHHYRWHHRWHRRHCWHRRYWSGRRCW
jgi:hypothetical protein